MTVTTGVGSVLFWALESAFLNAGVGMPATATATHQPFNPIVGTVELPMPIFEEELVYTQDSLDPNQNLTYDTEFTDGEGVFPNDDGMIYHDPFLMLGLIFPHKTKTGTWGGGVMRAEVSTIVAAVPGAIDDGDYITLSGMTAANVEVDYYLWFDKVGDLSGDPAPVGKTIITADISGSITAQDVSDAIVAAVTAIDNFGAANGATTTTTITNAFKGNVTDIADVDSGLAVATTVQGISAGILTGDFTDDDDTSTVMIQYKVVDSADAVIEEKTLNGVQCMEFTIGFVKDNVLRTKFGLIVADEQDNDRDYTADANFDDGKWADWAKSTIYPAASCRVYWDNAHAAELTDIKVEDAEFIIRVPKEHLKTGDSLKTQYQNKQNREYEANIKGYVFGDTELDEVRLQYTSKAKKDLRLQWDITANEHKFLDFQNAYIKSMDATKIPEAAEAYNVTLTFIAFSADFEGNYNNLTDPGDRVTV